MGTYVKKSPTKVGSYTSDVEKLYIEENLRYFIEKEKKVSRTFIGSGWSVHEDHTARLRYLLLDYISEHFNLYELYVTFYLQSVYGLSPDIIEESRMRAIEDINTKNGFTPDEAVHLKRKVWNMNPILYGLIHEFIHQSNLFWDEDKEEVVLPDFN